MIYLRGKIYWMGWQFKNTHFQESTNECNRKRAEEYQEDRKSEIRKEWEARVKKAKQVGCEPDELSRCAECNTLFRGPADAKQIFCGDECEEKNRKRQFPAPTLAEFLKSEFLPFITEKHRDKPNTIRYYRTGAADLSNSLLAGMRIGKITDQHAAQFAARRSTVSPSMINCGLRTLRRALRLANDWGKIDNHPKITLAKGERQRERVLTNAEIESYLSVCGQPWRDCATVMLGTGMRPGEAFSLRWESLQLNGTGGLVQIVDGKSKAARRMLPLVPAVFKAPKARHVEQGQPENGWVFPATRSDGHLSGGSAKNYHVRALAVIKAKKLAVKPFPPYTFRHTALTRLAEAGCDAFTLARIAGHSSITITQRY
jgi:integrase